MTQLPDLNGRGIFHSKEVIMKRAMLGLALLVVGSAAWLFQPAEAHIQENNGDYLIYRGKPVACGGDGENCYWSKPTTQGPEG